MEKKDVPATATDRSGGLLWCHSRGCERVWDWSLCGTNELRVLSEYRFGSPP